ncbi:MAG: NADH-quinone oxidoreductase subunit M, partial [Thermodesulfobacteriota bacterium]
MESLLSGNLSLVIFFPLLGIPLIVLLSYIYKGSEAEMKIAALAVSLIEFVLSIPLFTSFAGGFPGMQFVTKIPWIANLGISYHVGLDGISLFLV